MKNHYLHFIYLFICLSISIPVQAQVNAILLKDGSGNLISMHNSIVSAYAALPSTLTQAYIIELSATYDGTAETYPITFIAKTGASSLNTITIRPEAGVASVSISSTQTGLALISLQDADYIIIDGRPGGSGTSRALLIDNKGTSTISYGLEFKNGASNNIIRHCRFSGYTTSGTGGKAILIGASTNPDGNSNNRFEFLTFENGPRYYINCVGTSANPNRNTVVYGCEFLNINFCGWWQQAGTGKTTVDSCMFYSTGPAGSSGTGTFAILSDFQTDTLIITRNKIYNMDNSNYTTDAIGIALRSFNVGSVVRIFNNFISMKAPNTSTDELFGIEIGTNSANNPFDAQIYYNTVVIGGTASGGTSGNVNSAALSIANSDPLAKLDIRNNILINERSGGNEQHLAVSRISTLGSNTFDYNTYFTTGSDFARIGTTLYSNMAAYQAAAAPSEVQSNSVAVQFVSATDLHLAGSSILDPNLRGIFISSVTEDIDGHPRIYPYRGADEAEPIVSVPALMNPDVWTVYPVPATEYLEIKNKQALQSIELFTMQGVKVASVENINSTSFTLKTDQFNPGIYLLRIQSENSYGNKLIVIEN